MTTVYPYAPYHHLRPDNPRAYRQQRSDHAARNYEDVDELPIDHLEANSEEATSNSSHQISQDQYARSSRLHAAADPLSRARARPAQQHNAGEDMNNRPGKRRRSDGPDWDEFYRNGRPKEVIVIEDTPEAEPKPKATKTTNATTASNSTSQTTHRMTNGTAPRQAAKGSQSTEVIDVTTPVKARAQPATKVQSNASTKPNDQHGELDVSSSSAAATSSSSHNDFDQPAQALKRKRTRQQEVPETKRRRVEVDAAGCHTYKPPPFPPKKAPDVKPRLVRDSNRSKTVKVDDEDGHFIITPGNMVTERYQIVRLLGQGTFGKVVQAYDSHREEHVAIKIIRSVQKYRDASMIELRVLATLKANDEDNRYRCIHYQDCFDFRGHICIVTELLGQSVFDYLKANAFVPFPLSQIQSFARQLFTSVAFLHGLHLIHTDLKPENILLCDNEYQSFTYDRRIPSASTSTNRTASQRRVLFNTEMRLIDFGSATFDSEYHSSVVSTRHYRAPEIILGLGWSYPCDVWSIGCILVEFYTGDALFQTHDNLEHLAMMERVLDQRIDTHLVQRVNRSTSSNSASKLFKRIKLDYPKTDTKKSSVKYVKAMKRLDEIIPGHNLFMRNLLDLLKRIFVYDPAKRITAEEALKHEWFQDMAHADDGTEAAKIRLEMQAEKLARGKR